jgi:hypothetical protein
VSDARPPRTLPHSLESERNVLGGVLLHPAALADVSSRCSSRDFYLSATDQPVSNTPLLAFTSQGSTNPYPLWIRQRLLRRIWEQHAMPCVWIIRSV